MVKTKLFPAQNQRNIIHIFDNGLYLRIDLFVTNLVNQICYQYSIISSKYYKLIDIQKTTRPSLILRVGRLPYLHMSLGRSVSIKFYTNDDLRCSHKSKSRLVTTRGWWTGTCITSQSRLCRIRTNNDLALRASEIDINGC